MTKSSRQSKILDLISSCEIETQEDLVFRLKYAGYDATQATVSRDIKELNIVKSLSPKTGVYVYCQLKDTSSSLSQKLVHLFRETVLSVKAAKNLVVVKTLSNCAAACWSVVDEMKISDILGQVYSADTVLIVLPDDDVAESVAEKLQSLIV